MPRHLGYRDVWENCYRSTFGKEAAMRYGERFYCERGRRIDTFRYIHYYNLRRIYSTNNGWPPGKN